MIAVLHVPRIFLNVAINICLIHMHGPRPPASNTQLQDSVSQLGKRVMPVQRNQLGPSRLMHARDIAWRPATRAVGLHTCSEQQHEMICDLF